MATRAWLRENYKYLLFGLAAALLIFLLFFYKLGSLIGGLSVSEFKVAGLKMGWTGIINDPLYLPLKFVRSFVFFVFTDHGQTLTRLPNALFGIVTVAAFSYCIWLWHGIRTCFLISVLFITSAWVLHVSRTASYDVLYLWAIPTLLLVQALIHEYKSNKIVWLFAVASWTAIAFIPGMIWLILAQFVIKRKDFVQAYKAIPSNAYKLALLIVPLLGLALLGLGFTRDANVALWLGVNTDVQAVDSLKRFLGVPLHLLLLGPLYPDIWLGRAPIFDAFTWLCAALGVYFYIRKFRAVRAITLFVFIIICTVLVGTLGLEVYSSLVSLGYMIAAAGIAYLTYEWMKVFPKNPLARTVGVSIIATLVCLACIYNLRSYYVAWPHNAEAAEHFNNRL